MLLLRSVQMRATALGCCAPKDRRLQLRELVVQPERPASGAAPAPAPSACSPKPLGKEIDILPPGLGRRVHSGVRLVAVVRRRAVGPPVEGGRGAQRRYGGPAHPSALGLNHTYLMLPPKGLPVLPKHAEIHPPLITAFPVQLPLVCGVPTILCREVDSQPRSKALL